MTAGTLAADGGRLTTDLTSHPLNTLPANGCSLVPLGVTAGVVPSSPPARTEVSQPCKTATWIVLSEGPL